MSFADDVKNAQVRVCSLVERFYGEDLARAVGHALRGYCAAEDTHSKLRLQVDRLQARIRELEPPPAYEPPPSYRSTCE